MGKTGLSPFLFDHPLTKKYRSCMLFGNLFYMNDFQVEEKGGQCILTPKKGGRCCHPFVTNSIIGAKAVIRYLARLGFVGKEEENNISMQIESLSPRVAEKPIPGKFRFAAKKS